MKRIVLRVTLALVALYIGGYAYCRLARYLVHDATFYTDPAGRMVKTDEIRLGEQRWDGHWLLIEQAYTPLRLLEGAYWRSR